MKMKYDYLEYMWGRVDSTLTHQLCVYNAREELNMTVFAFTDSTSPISILSRRFCYVATPFWNGQGLTLKMTSSSWKSFIRSFSRHVQHQSQEWNLKRPKIHFFFGEQDWFTMWWQGLALKMTSSSWHSFIMSFGRSFSRRIKFTSSGKEFFYCAILKTLFL